jgi:murein DD-endopeptidase MepM/ murein hydrolase activator NlpD
MSTPPVFDSLPAGEQVSAEPKTRTPGDSLQTSDESPVENVSPKPNGSYHKLKRGETFASLSRLYKVPLATLMESNRVSDPNKLRAGTSIFIPTVSDPVAPQSTTVGALAWPLQGRITGKFGPRGERSRHKGIDIDGQAGEEIKAVASGTVTQAGIRGKYGRVAIIDHGDGLTTLYAHLGKLMVRVGDRVERGDPIAEVGRSGNATGTHLHFEVHRDGRPVDPIRYLQSDALAGGLPAPNSDLTGASQVKIEASSP